jgi:hypothetical protein
MVGVFEMNERGRSELDIASSILYWKFDAQGAPLGWAVLVQALSSLLNYISEAAIVDSLGCKPLWDAINEADGAPAGPQIMEHPDSRAAGLALMRHSLHLATFWDRHGEHLRTLTIQAPVRGDAAVFVASASFTDLVARFRAALNQSFQQCGQDLKMTAPLIPASADTYSRNLELVELVQTAWSLNPETVGARGERISFLRLALLNAAATDFSKVLGDIPPERLGVFTAAMAIIGDMPLSPVPGLDPSDTLRAELARRSKLLMALVSLSSLPMARELV